ncbi:MFS general substrate transporter [Multifurca ochricompacta]|uniref:MFS general substrate transporter n=1 Tax=Multifurca ochricompacta TaxID=376703 RepID=A0AAD4QT40_9AGAM|nr:MFS general substrate transporter [Multifurca ochricompacta]
MTPTPISGVDPDPTTQIPWPGARKSKRPDREVDPPGATPSSNTSSRYNSPRRPSVVSRTSRVDSNGKKRLSSFDLFNLSISMAGAQIAWTLWNPFLLSLGISEQITSLVWLAGPISGLIAQPVIGAISDSSTSKYRRRYWIALSTVALVVSTLTLAYCQDIASIFVDVFRTGAGDWDPKQRHQASNIAIGLAVVSFYVLDFALNALQASLRNLLLDIAPPEQLSAGNAWHSRMTQAGNIIGYGFGFLPLASLPIIRLLGGDQFRKFCVLVMFVLVITVWVTCYTQTEEERILQRPPEGTFREIWNNIYIAVVALPKPIRRVCYVQIFAFMGCTTYVGQVMAQQYGKEPDKDLATRTGALAMLLHSIVAVAAGTVLPYLARRDVRLLAQSDDEDEDAELTRLRDTVRQWQAEAASKGMPLRLPIMPFLLRNIWMGAMLLFSIITASTIFITKVWQAIAAVSLIGICWAVACWVPFAIIMEFLKELDRPVPERPIRNLNRRTSHTRTISTPNLLRTVLLSERQPLLTRRRSFEDQGDIGDGQKNAPVAGGTILGIHNLAIVFPQFLTAIASSAIFRLADTEVHNDPTNSNSYYGKNGVAWVLRFGGLCTLFGAVLCRMVPPTRTEKEMRRRLGEMMVLKQEQTP